MAERSVPSNCGRCGKEFFPIRGSAGKYCSISCSVKAQHAARAVPLAERFWAKVNKTDGCWEWTASRGPKGYGYFVRDGTRRPGRRSESAHRVSWEMAHGPIPEGLYVLHKCDNPPCVRPDHLFLGTKADNNRDMHQKGRNNQPKGEANRRAKLTEDQVRMIRAARAAGRPLKPFAKKYGVHHAIIYAVANRRNWCHL
jgi:hypothetical protein